MHRTIRLLSVTVAISLPLLSALATQAKVQFVPQRATYERVLTRENEQQGEREGWTTSWGSIYTDFFSRENDPKGDRKGGVTSRGDLCAITPVGEVTAMGDRPVFVWQGRLSRIAIRPAGSEEILWSKSVSPEDGRAVYDGEPLQPGEYQWLFFDEFSGDSPFATWGITFEVVGTNPQLAAKLEEFEGVNPEEIAFKRAEYLASEGFLEDALQAAYSVEAPSPELMAFTEEVATTLCDPDAN